jgi:hypothetical protein
MINFLSKRKATKVAALCIVFGLGFFTLSANLYVRFHYAAVMPRIPQPSAGRIYAIPAQYGGVVYVNKHELDRRKFVENDLMTVFGGSMLLLFLVGTLLGWFKDSRFGTNPQSGK